MKKYCFFLIVLCAMALMLVCCTGKNTNNNQSESIYMNLNIAVFIPGVMSGSPIYEMLAQGVQNAAGDFNNNVPDQNAARVIVIEGGFNQAEWENQVTSLAASGNYDLIVSSNPSLPVIVSSVSSRFPNQKFLLLDGELTGNPSVYSLRYNQREQAYTAGFLAALLSLENPGADKRLGLVAAQEYPVMNNTILPAYLEGARAVDPDFTVDFRVVGNWFDAVKAAELAAEMIRAGVSVLLPVAGGANEGIVQTAAEAGAKVIWFDTNGYDIRPGTVAGSAILHQDLAAYEKTMLYFMGELPFGTADIGGINDGYVDFIEDDPIYISTVSSSIRERMAALMESIRAGELVLDN